MSTETLYPVKLHLPNLAGRGCGPHRGRYPDENSRARKACTDPPESADLADESAVENSRAGFDIIKTVGA
jgi:hypothetical protein